MTKGNFILNWDNDYRVLDTTYSETVKSVGDLFTVSSYETVYADLRAHIKAEHPATLEVGCGGSRGSLYLAQRGCDVTCMDFSAQAIALSRRNFAKVGASGRFVQRDFIKDPLPQERYDCVMSYGLLEHFEDVFPILDRMTTCLKPGGLHIHTIIPKKFSTDTVMNAVWYPFRLVKNVARLSFHDLWRRSFRDFPHYENSLSRAEYRRVFERTGNRVLKCTAMGAAHPLIALPLGLGNLLAAHFQGPLRRLIEATNHSDSAFMGWVSPVIYMVCQRT